MQVDILTAIIVGVFALGVGLLSFLASVLKNRADIRNLHRTIQEDYMKSIFDKRVAAYSDAWHITGQLSSLNLKAASNPVREVREAIRKLHDWYNNVGGILLSAESRDRYFELRKISMELKENASLADVKRVWLSKMNFRTSLRKDIQLEKELLKHSEEDWDFPEYVEKPSDFAKYKEKGNGAE